jgi:hypothetical protein
MSSSSWRQGPRKRCPATVQVMKLAKDYSLAVLDYRSRGSHLLSGGLRQLQFLHDAFPRHVAGFLGGTGKLSSRLDGFSVSEMCGIPVQQNLERSWNHCCSVSSSSLSEVSSITTASSPSLASRRSFALDSSFPCVCSSSYGGGRDCRCFRPATYYGEYPK